jgi:MFS family permease
VGFAAGPALAGLLIDGLGQPIPVVFWVSSGLSLMTAVMLAVGSREIRPETVPSGPVLRLAFGAIRGVLVDPLVRRLFLVYGTAFLANQLTRPYVPVLVERMVGLGPGLASAIALVAGSAALAGALLSPLTGALGDRIGFRRILVLGLVGGGLTLGLMPVATSPETLALIALAFATCVTGVGAMVVAMLATEVAPERRSATLNLVYLPLYLAGVIGPALGSVVVQVADVPGPFRLGALVFLAGAIAVGLLLPRGERPGRPPSASA